MGAHCNCVAVGLGICSDSHKQNKEEGGSTPRIKPCHGYSLQTRRIPIRNNKQVLKEGWHR
jgi:hypothetical protein